MAFTKHGQYIPDTTYEGVGEDPIVECGGPDECDDCHEEVVDFYKEVANAEKCLRRGEFTDSNPRGIVRDLG